MDCGHTPFRRDCRICQESSAKARPHRSVPNPICGVLSVDVTGPLKASKVDGKRMRYILVGAFTWIKPTTVASPAEAHLPDVEEGEIPLEEDHEEEVHEDAEEDALGGEGSAEPGEVAAEEEGAEVEEEVEIKDGFETVTYRLAIPLESRNSGEVMAAVHEMYVRLRILGYPVTRLHSDKAREFMSQLMVNWCRNRNIMKTSTAAMTSQANGRAERAIQDIKMKIRRALLAAGWGQDRWVYACYFVHEIERRRMTYKTVQEIPRLGEEVLVKKKIYHASKSAHLEPTHVRVWYISPKPEQHGHMVMKENGTTTVAPYYIARTRMPPESDETWLALSIQHDEQNDPIQERRRLRGKMAVKQLTFQTTVVESGEAHEEGVNAAVMDQHYEREETEVRVRQVLEEEGGMMLSTKDS